MADIDLEGFGELDTALEQVQAIAIPIATLAISQGLQAIEAKIAPYPPQPDRDRANQDHKHPSPYNTWVRNAGAYPRSAFRSVPGGKGQDAWKIKHVAVKSLSRASEQMSKKFRIQVGVSQDAVVGELRNDASYSGWVIGSKDASQTPHQAAWHAETGWVAKEDAIEQAMPFISQAVDDAIDQVLNRIIKR